VQVTLGVRIQCFHKEERGREKKRKLLSNRKRGGRRWKGIERDGREENDEGRLKRKKGKGTTLKETSSTRMFSPLHNGNRCSGFSPGSEDRSERNGP
jgi:hypothetical protein